ncbi:MAG: hypothetical protein WCC74_02310 [Minisyncoccia bacterium]
MASSKTAKEILRENIDSWGEQKITLPINADEMRIIVLSQGAVVKKLNHDNDDGTFFTSVEYEGKLFVCSTSSKI